MTSAPPVLFAGLALATLAACADGSSSGAAATETPAAVTSLHRRTCTETRDALSAFLYKTDVGLFAPVTKILLVGNDDDVLGDEVAGIENVVGTDPRPDDIKATDEELRSALTDLNAKCRELGLEQPLLPGPSATTS